MKGAARLYLWDIDGTILLSGGASTRALDRVFLDRYGVAGAMATINCAGKTDPIIIGEIFAANLGRAPRDAEVDDVLADYVPLLRSELSRSPGFVLMPYVCEALDHLAARGDALLGIATGNVRAAAQAKLERADLWQRFAVGGYGCDHFDRGRLVRRAIERGSELAGREFRGDEVVVIGDTPLDVAAARACGARAVLVATGYAADREVLRRAQADVLLEDLSGLAAWIEEQGVHG